MSFKATHYMTKKSYHFEISEGTFSKMESIPYDETLPIISPGFTDIQINGYTGIDFNDSFDFEQANQVLTQFLQLGIHQIYPTIITNEVGTIIKLGGQIGQWMDENPLAREMVKGIHLEGPYISPKDGARGAHNLDFVKAPDIEEFKSIQNELKQMIKICTLSPEWSEAMPFIEALGDEVIIAIGHTTATSDEIHEAVTKGAKLSTHLGNGAEGMLPRHPNYIWTQLANDELYTSVIADGFHLHADVLKIMHRMKNNKLILVSDAVSLAGMPAGDYVQAVGGNVSLSEEGRLYLTDSPQYLAGSAKNLWQCMQHFHQTIEPDAFKVIQSVTSNVQALMKQEDPIIIGNKADFVLVDPLEFKVIASYLCGKDWK